jgi:hypothetical protein
MGSCKSHYVNQGYRHLSLSILKHFCAIRRASDRSRDSLTLRFPFADRIQGEGHRSGGGGRRRRGAPKRRVTAVAEPVKE